VPLKDEEVEEDFRYLMENYIFVNTYEKILEENKEGTNL
jgi:hypothetical protein